METEHITVPLMPGYHYLGHLRPAFNLPCHYINDKTGQLEEASNGDVLLRICYRKIKTNRLTLESTGEFRFPKKNEWYKKGNTYAQAEEDLYFSQHEIYRIVEEQS
jgi:hypothetical protein